MCKEVRESLKKYPDHVIEYMGFSDNIIQPLLFKLLMLYFFFEVLQINNKKSQYKQIPRNKNFKKLFI